MAVSVTWPQMLPQDRVELLQEVVQRRASGLISTARGIEKFGDVEDIEAEIDRIDEDASKEMKLQRALKSLSTRPNQSNKPQGG